MHGLLSGQTTSKSSFIIEVIQKEFPAKPRLSVDSPTVNFTETVANAGIIRNTLFIDLHYLQLSNNKLNMIKRRIIQKERKSY